MSSSAASTASRCPDNSPPTTRMLVCRGIAHAATGMQRTHLEHIDPHVEVEARYVLRDPSHALHMHKQTDMVRHGHRIVRMRLCLASHVCVRGGSPTLLNSVVLPMIASVDSDSIRDSAMPLYLYRRRKDG